MPPSLQEKNSRRAALQRASERLPFRAVAAILFVALHLLMFRFAGWDRLGLPFNAAPGSPPYYSDTSAPSLGQEYPRQPHHWSRLVVSRWDSQHYIGFAIRGFRSCPTNPRTASDADYAQCGALWFPTYGLVARAIAAAVGIAPDVALMALSCLAAFAINLLWTSSLLRARLGHFETYASLIAFNVFPTAFYVVTPYTEAPTLAFALGGLVLLGRNQWGLAAISVGAATAMRANAVAFALGFGIAAIAAAMQRRRAVDARWWHPLVAIPIAGWGLAATLLYYHVELGDALAYLRAQAAYAANVRGNAWDLVDAVYYLKGVTAQHMDMVVLFASLALVMLAGRHALGRLPRAVAIYLAVAGVATIAVPLFTFASSGLGYWGINRFLLLCPVIFLSAGVASRKYRGLYVLWIGFCVAFYWHVELCSYVAHGDRARCPCLGRTQFSAPFQS